ncbi:MAG TPA: flagellar assembly protein FliW [Leptospiraceae bacterium]|jgi:flagellar assembly factor FliW|nr:flagellar assembly protein FliW [Leptospirales bacterium]HMU83395.1 flagellar assembly protein FliW [Leptospiraceae bacterium]HMW59843.1 flagellar assembly protein FliW [Leptospiraceae bacterium]HMX55081.1 flagellar assembly protein FliW [Leptospiraceae bacterium]HMY45758.1 flagellar assembly protein FliW [Leptospiraceae bacterium]
MTKTGRTLETKALGKITLDPEQLLSFPEGLYGFRDFHEFALVEESAENPFKWLQSTSDPALAFIVIQPELILSGYRPEVAREDLQSIGLSGVDESLVFLIVTIPENDPESMTANLQGPVLINKTTKQGRQAISMNEKHVVRLPVLSQVDA